MTGFAAGTLSIAICGRCKMKRPYAELRPDGNLPGVRVCNRGCWDSIDPYRLPARKPEAIALRYPRPDTPLGTDPAGLITNQEDGFIMTDDGEGYIKP